MGWPVTLALSVCLAATIISRAKPTVAPCVSLCLSARGLVREDERIVLSLYSLGRRCALPPASPQPRRSWPRCSRRASSAVLLLHGRIRLLDRLRLRAHLLLLVGEFAGALLGERHSLPVGSLELSELRLGLGEVGQRLLQRRALAAGRGPRSLARSRPAASVGCGSQ